jgi:transposase
LRAVENDGVSVLVDNGRRGCEPVVPRNPRHPGRKRLDIRKVLCRILFVHYTGIRWEFLSQVRRFEITPHISRRGIEHGSGLGVYRWVVEGALALLHWFRRLRIRWEIRDDIHNAFLTLGCAIICWRRLRNHSIC